VDLRNAVVFVGSERRTDIG